MHLNRSKTSEEDLQELGKIQEEMGLFRALAAIGVRGESDGAVEKKMPADHIEMSV